MTRVPLARPSVEPSLHHFYSFHDPSPGFGSERTHLDRTVRGSRAARCPLEACVKGWHLYDCESSQLFFGVSIRTVLHAAPSVLFSYCASCFRFPLQFASA